MRRSNDLKAVIISRTIPFNEIGPKPKSQMGLSAFMKVAFTATVLMMFLPCTISARIQSLNPETNQNHYFPDSLLVLDMAVLSNAVYHLKNKVQSCNDSQAKNNTLINLIQEEGIGVGGNNDQTDAQDIFHLLLPEGTECLHYSHDYSIGTQVLVVRSSLHNYVAVSYAGTDDWQTALMDGDILTSDFGPSNITQGDNDDTHSIFEGVPDGVRVHRGFNEAVFENDGFHKILSCVSSARLGGDCDDDIDDTAMEGTNNMETNPSSAPYQLFTTGHSLGAADSVLLGAALHLAYPNETLRSINFGCPKIGNARWSFWLDSLQPDKRATSSGTFEIFRFVNKIDLVPRLPELPVLTHAGHTLQMSVGGEVKAYYDHLGNEDLGYEGVPFGWEAAPYALLPFALASHLSRHYVEYLDFYKPNSTNSNNTSLLYYVKDFERADDPDNSISSLA